MEPQAKTAFTLPLSDIIVEDRLRTDYGELDELAESIRDNGLLHPLVVEEKEGKYFLRTGGRRYAAFTLLSANKVQNADPSYYSHVPVRIFNSMPPHQRIKIELEENLRRKDMSWIEKINGIVRYHKAAERAALIDKTSWTQRMTGELLNMSQASVSIAFTVKKELDNGNEKVLAAESLTDALKALTADQLDKAQAEQMRRINLKRAEAARVQPTGTPAVARVASSILVSAASQAPETVVDKVQFTKEQIADFYHQGDCLDVLPRLRAVGTTISHIICDPPYGINMSALVGDSVERVEETHDVSSNLELLPKFLKAAYDAIEPDGFLCMWYDLDHHEKIGAWALEVGWRVCRWPLVWCKTSSCRNSQAQYNITKSTEVCYLFRRSENSILKRKRSVNYLLCDGASNASHPFTKPAELWQWLIDTVSLPGQTICDPFAGEGSSLVPAFKSGRTPVGIEIDPKHIASGVNFIQEQLNKKNILDDIMEPPL